jgi:hypothetical protein
MTEHEGAGIPDLREGSLGNGSPQVR